MDSASVLSRKNLGSGGDLDAFETFGEGARRLGPSMWSGLCLQVLPLLFFLCRGSDHDAISVTVSLGTPPAPAPPAQEEQRPAADQPEQSNQTNQTVQVNESNATNSTQPPNETVIPSEPAATSFS